MKYIIILSLLCASTQSIAKKKYYKWTDADGNSHYSETKPANKDVKEIKVRSEKKVEESNDESDEQQSFNVEVKEEEKTPMQKAIEEFNENEKIRVTAKQNIANCKIAKKNLATLQKTVRIQQKNPATGEYIRMDDDERIAMMKKAKNSIKELCR